MSQSSLFRMPTSASNPHTTQVSTEYKKAPTEDVYEVDTSSPAGSSAAESCHNSCETLSARRWWKVLLIQLFCLTWTGPIMYLLFLNFKDHIVGPSSWCPEPYCWVEPFGYPITVQDNIARLAVWSRNFNNILQYAAKVLELWFGVIAGALLYILVMRVAQSRHGLSIRLVTLPNEFPNLLTSFDSALWMSLKAPHALGSRVVWTLVLLISIFMGLLVNLMGPATATLVLPTLKWVKTAPVSQGWFHTIDTNLRPGAMYNGFAVADSGCSIDDLALGRYSCATHWSRTLDAWTSSAVGAFIAQDTGNSGKLAGTTSLQSGLTLYLNQTLSESGEVTAWVPSRQTLARLNQDQWVVANISWGFDAKQMGVTDDVYQQFAVFNKSLGVKLRRDGLVFGASPTFYVGKPWTAKVDENRGVMCFPNYTVLFVHHYTGLIDDTQFTKCIQVGDGWAESYDGQVNRSRRFSIDADNVATAPILVDVLSSSVAVFIHPEVPATNDSWLEDRSKDLPTLCLNETIPDGLFCNWTHFFGRYNYLSVLNESSYVNTLAFSQTWDNGTSKTIAIDYRAQVAYTTYELDPWAITNPLNLVQMPDLKHGLWNLPFAIDPSWTFAAWGVDWEDGHVLHNRSIATLWHSTMAHLQEDQDQIYLHGYADNTFMNTLFAALVIPVVQAMSLSEWTTIPYKDKNHDHSMELMLQARVYVWAYGFDSKTARLAGAVGVAGCLVAISQFFAGFHQRRRRRTLTQVLLAALASRSHVDVHAEERSRFHITDAEGEAGGLRFARWSAR